MESFPTEIFTLIGSTVSHYRITERLGSGGMGMVYRAFDESLGREVAIKFVHDETIGDDSAHARLLREARTASALNHPAICVVHEVGEHKGAVFVVMELLEGRTLARALMERKLTPDEARGLGLELADALAHAHERGVIHRDVKSSNIVITSDGRAKILDFGVARRFPVQGTQGAKELNQPLTELSFTAPLQIVGTLSYMAPEVLRGETAGPASDIWSLGVVLYESMTGHVPFGGRTEFETSAAILHDPSPEMPAEVPRGLAAIVGRCLERDMDRRFGRARELQAALRDQTGTVIEAPPDASRIRSLVVLPLDNMSGDPTQEMFVDGMTEELIAGLAKLGALRVISRTTAMRFKGANRPLPDIARELNVDAVLEGSVRRGGDRVRITVQLVHAASDTHLWAESYERELRDVLSLQSDVATAVAKEIQLKLSPEAEARLAPARPVNPEAFEAALRARFYLGKRTEESILKSIDMFRQAIDLDPGYALAYAGLADAYSMAGYYTLLAPADSFPLAKAAAARALEIQPQLAEGLVAYAYAQFYWDWDWRGAEENLGKASKLTPSYASTYHFTGTMYAIRQMGEEAAAALFQRGRDLDPLSLIVSVAQAWGFLHFGKYEEALAVFRRALEFDPSFMLAHLWKGRTLLEMGRLEEAEAALQQAVKLSGGAPFALSYLGNFHARRGCTEDAMKVLAELDRQKERRYVSAMHFAIVHAGLGDVDRVFDYIERAYEERTHMLLFVPIDPSFEGIRGDPRYGGLLRRLATPR